MTGDASPPEDEPTLLLRPRQYTVYPADPNSRAIPRPMPLLEPVTTAIRPFPEEGTTIDRDNAVVLVAVAANDNIATVAARKRQGDIRKAAVLSPRPFSIITRRLINWLELVYS
mmetsp:Transcript_10217/g.23930  ORF Transcript_10217/g.23930 Transcript_10217/m.23930 type:complete len:114 (+) Transcript_10217:58-399(+)